MSVAAHSEVTPAVYTIAEHQHRLAAWAAATAARASSQCRFEVEHGVGILEAAGFVAELCFPNELPAPECIDQVHGQWRLAAIAEAQRRGFVFSHGVAAKLINVYTKVRFVVAGHHEHPKVRCLHPPIDRLMLGELTRANAGGARERWRKAMQKGWSNYDSADYQSVIDLIRSVLDGQPMWMIEQYWRGHQ
jgi:hypothetical protein